MTKYKRWILLLAALTTFVVDVESLRATSLIHSGKFSKLHNTTTTSTTSTTSEPAQDKSPRIIDDDDEGFVEVNGTKIALTGIPQIDYVWDPNLPRELNGFNLSTYPFLDSMPAEEDIGFDCDGKINGFYASIKYSCQLYHHCLYGVRSDFICANFTGFDQKTFICHFVSEVDCKNSYKYWSRNDDLYKATTEKPTSAQPVPVFDRNLYKRPGPGSPNTSGNRDSSKKESQADPAITAAPIPLSPIASIQNLRLNGLHNEKAQAQQPPSRNNNRNEDYIDSLGVQRPAGNRPMRRPYRRRRPQVDYYYYDDEYEDDFYDDRGRRRQRPRNRRPIYDDYDSRRPYDRDRRPADDFDDYEYDRRPYRNRNRSESRRNGEGDRRKYEDRRFDDRRRPYNDDRRQDDRRKPVEDERRSYDDRRHPEDRRTDDRRTSDDRKKFDDDRDVAEDRKIIRRKNNDEPVESQSEKRQATTEEAELPLKPPASLFERPRPSPKISRPLVGPLSDKNKFSQESQKKSEEKKKEEEYYDDEYYDAPSAPASTSTAKSTTTTTTKITTTSTTTPKTSSVITKYSPRLKTPTTPMTTKKSTTTTTTTPQYSEDYYEEYEDTVTSSTTAKPKDTFSLYSRHQQLPDNFRLNRFRSSVNETTTAKIVEETSRKPLPTVKKFANKQTSFDSTTEDSSKATVPGIDVRFRSDPDPSEERDQKFFMKIIKRPFLPSRGGNPYKGRGLLPVGPSSLDVNSPQFTSPAPGIDVRGNFQQEPTTQHRTTLEDIYNEEYDVELNDALNPMLKPLTSSRGVSGFSFSSLANVANSEQDAYRSQSQKSIQKAPAPKKSATTTTTTEPPQYDYEEYEEYDV